MAYKEEIYLEFRNKVRQISYNCCIVVTTYLKEASNFVFDNFMYYKQRGHTFSICCVEIKKIYVDMKEKDRLWIEYVETDKPSKRIKKASLRMKYFKYYQEK